MESPPEKEAHSVSTEIEYYALVGMIIDSAARADLVLFNTFRILLQTEPTAASVIYFATDSTTTKTKIVNALAYYYCADDKERELVSKITGNMLEINSARNDVAHSMRGVKGLKLEDGKPRRVNPKNLKQSLRETTNTPLTATAKRLDKLATEARAAYFELCDLRGEPQEVLVAQG